MNKVSVLNSLLLAICISVTAWVGHKTADNAEALAAMRVAVEAAKDSSGKTEKISADALVRVERKLDDMVPRRELDARLLQIETEQHRVDIHLREIDLEILKLKKLLP